MSWDPVAAEQQADVEALEAVTALLQRPDQLERLDMLQKQAERKLANTEAMLRTAVHSQLEAIRAAMNHLNTASSDIRQIEQGMHNIYTRLQTVPGLRAGMNRLCEANAEHSQYAAAMDNLKTLSSITDTIERTHDYIQDGNLLHAHKNIMELENARDELMNEVYKIQSDRRDYDLNLLRKHFSDVDKLVDALGAQLWYICSRARELVLQDQPQKLVAALRIIEREHRIDDHYDRMQQSAPGAFVPPGRPRAWRAKLFDVLLSQVRQRVEGNQFEDRTTNSQWLARYLEVCRNTVVDDLKVVKSGLVPCFPPEHQIYNRMLKYYHDSISSRLKEIADEPLKKNEVVQLLNWVKSYGDETMLGNPKLGIKAPEFLHANPLLPRSTLDRLYERFAELTQLDMRSWLGKAIEHERDDWLKKVPPEEDHHRQYYTQFPSILFGMIHDQIAIGNAISAAIVPRIIEIATAEFLESAVRFRDAAAAYRDNHFEHRSPDTPFTATMIAVANNMDICYESTEKLEKHIRLAMEAPLAADSQPATPKHSATAEPASARSLGGTTFAVNRQEVIEQIEELKRRWRTVMQYAIQALLDEVYVDIARHLESLVSRKWLVGSDDLETICATVYDYYTHDHTHLRSHIKFALLKELMFKIVGEYIIGLEGRRLTFGSYDERDRASSRLVDDAKTIQRTFHSLEKEADFPFTLITPVLADIADILALREKSLLTLEVTGFVRKYPDITADLLSTWILAREDVGRNEAREIAETACENARFVPKGDAEMQKLFGMAKAGPGGLRRGVAAVPVALGDVQNAFATLLMTASRDRGGA